MDSKLKSVLIILRRALVYPVEYVQSELLLENEMKVIGLLIPVYFFTSIITSIRLVIIRGSFSMINLMIPFLSAFIGYASVHIGIAIETFIVHKLVILGLDSVEYTKLIVPYYIISSVTLIVFNLPGLTILSLFGLISVSLWALVQRLFIFRYRFGAGRIKKNGILLFLIINILNIGMKIWFIYR